MDFVGTTRTAAERDRWCGIAVKSSVVLQQPCKIVELHYTRLRCSTLKSGMKCGQ